MYLIETALHNLDEVYGLLAYEPGEEPGGVMRLAWLKEMYPRVHWTIVENVIGEENNSEFWAEYTIRTLVHDFDFTDEIDYVVSSEPYGVTWAAELGCQHMEVDIARTKFPISGSLARSNPLIYWDYLSPPARGYYAHRVCLVGGESTGKTTLAARLARHFDCLWVPEVGRFYTEKFGTDPEDPGVWSTILSDQLALENHMATMTGKGLLICDTDLLTTSIWYKNWVGEEDEVYKVILNDYIANGENRWSRRPYDHYLVLTPDVGWVDDGTRSEGDKRMWYHEELVAGVKASGVPYTLIDGSNFDIRTAAACFDVVGTYNERTSAGFEGDG